ncbi:MAG TPA: YadA-like family protein [Stenotrophomonas sp.]
MSNTRSPLVVALAIALAMTQAPAHAQQPSPTSDCDASDDPSCRAVPATLTAASLDATDLFDAVGDGSGGDIAQALGDSSTAAGGAALALGAGSSAFGWGSAALGDFSLAAGYGSSALGYSATAVGGYAVLPDTFYNPEAIEIATAANGDNSAAFGPGAVADGLATYAAGAGAHAVGDLSNAIGLRALSDGIGSIALGGWSQSYGIFSTAVGYQSTANGESATAIGSGSQAQNYNTSALGANAMAMEDNATAVGGISWAGGIMSTAVGSAAQAAGLRATALGNGSWARDDYSTALGSLAQSNGAGSIAIGGQATAGGFNPFPPPLDEENPCWECYGLYKSENAIALGTFAQAFKPNSVAIGYDSLANGENSVAIGAGSWADRDNAVSIGASQERTNLQYSYRTMPAQTRQLINLSAGTEDTDAVNLSQLKALAAVFGGDIDLTGGTVTAPTFNIQGQAYGNVGAAFAAVDARLSQFGASLGDLQGQIDEIPPPPPPPAQPQPTSTDGVVYTDDGRGTIELEGAAGTRISNLADGQVASDAANLGQVQQGDAATLQTSQSYTDATASRTLSTANAYTDGTATRTLTTANAYTDSRFNTLNDRFDTLSHDVERRLATQDKRIDRMGAMSSAMMGMAMNAAGARTPGGRLAVGAGFQNGESALAVGYSRRIGERASVSIGSAFNDEDQSASLGFGVDL